MRRCSFTDGTSRCALPEGHEGEHAGSAGKPFVVGESPYRAAPAPADPVAQLALDVMNGATPERDPNERVYTPSDHEIDRFVIGICHRAGVRVHHFPDGSRGLIDVPAKYVAVIDALHVALMSVAAGDGLPELAPIQEPKKRRKRGRR